MKIRHGVVLWRLWAEEGKPSTHPLLSAFQVPTAHGSIAKYSLALALIGPLELDHHIVDMEKDKVSRSVRSRRQKCTMVT